jgi:hypothetical protein
MFPWESSMPTVRITLFSFRSNSFAFIYIKIIPSCSLKFRNLVTFALKVFQFAFAFGSSQFMIQSAVIFSVFLIIDTLLFPLLFHFTDHFLVIHGFLALFWIFPTQSLIVSNRHFLMLFHCPSIFLFTQSPARSFSSRDSYTFCRWACNISKSNTGFLFCILRFSSV